MIISPIHAIWRLVHKQNGSELDGDGSQPVVSGSHEVNCALLAAPGAVLRRHARAPAAHHVPGEPGGVLLARIYQDWGSGLRSRDSVRD